MKRKLFLVLPAIVAVAAGVVGFSAFEAHIINVTAHIENALDVRTKALDFGTVFPQEALTQSFDISLSGSFTDATRVDDVHYNIVQKPKCKANDSENPIQFVPVDRSTELCPAGYTQMLNLCPFLSKTTTEGNDTSHLSYFQNNSCPDAQRINKDQPGFGDGGWAGWSCPAGTLAVGGAIDSSDNPVHSGVAAPGAPAVDGISYPVYPHYTFPAGETGFVVHDVPD
jgi:hypothetical protein